MTDFTITYENNIFYCTKNNTKWISVDGEKWYGEEKRITELERKNRLLGERCNQLLKDKGDLTDKIADIKANCDLAIEGRDVKIMELEQKLEQTEKDLLGRYDGFLAGLKAGRPQWQWHDLRKDPNDLPKGDDGFSKSGIHRNIYLKDRYGHLYTGNYFPKDETHKEDCFAVEFLEWGFQGSRFCAKEQILEWCEIPTFDKEK